MTKPPQLRTEPLGPVTLVEKLDRYAAVEERALRTLLAFLGDAATSTETFGDPFLETTLAERTRADA